MGSGIFAGDNRVLAMGLFVLNDFFLLVQELLNA